MCNLRLCCFSTYRDFTVVKVTFQFRISDLYPEDEDEMKTCVANCILLGQAGVNTSILTIFNITNPFFYFQVKHSVLFFSYNRKHTEI